MASGGEGYQGIVLKLTPLVYVPVSFVTDNSHKPIRIAPGFRGAENGGFFS